MPSVVGNGITEKYAVHTGDPKNPFTFEIRAILNPVIFSMFPESGIDNVLDELGLDKSNFAWSVHGTSLPHSTI